MSCGLSSGSCRASSAINVTFELWKERKFSKQFKENAVKLSYERSSLASLAKELGITSSMLSKWRKEFTSYGSASFQGRGVERLTDDQRRIKELEKYLKDKELELDILKKAIAVFSKIDK